METVTQALRMATAAAPVLDDVLREGARSMLQRAIEREVSEYVEAHQEHLDGRGHRLVVRNGHLPARKVLTGLGPIEVRQPRVNDRRVDAEGNRLRFTSKILPPYLRRAKSVEELVPWLYLKGISSSDFPEALSALGHDGSGLSATNVIRMKELWREEWAEWSKRSLLGKRYVYLWVDGIYFNIRLADEGEGRQCVLVVMGATEEGVKELVARSWWRSARATARASSRGWSCCGT